jgi:hypothetical protein
MKLDTIYSTIPVETLAIKNTVKFGFDDNAKQMIFKMFSSNIYSNPIGSVVREISSNCFDSHIEAKVSDPVILRLAKENNDLYISFIDVGVGISPERMKTQYASAFSSSKRDSNDQIGGFGVGSLSLMSYIEKHTKSYYLLTRYNGIEYLYNIRKGLYEPEADLIYEIQTTERNGTTIKLPIRNNDLDTFEKEITRQLFYFENIIFEGFSEKVKNNYTIIEGKNFLYRQGHYDGNVHISLGRVLYPINFSLFDEDDNFNIYDWCNLPIALKLNVGDINVTVSRESIDYTEETKSFIRNKLLELKEELINLLIDQNKNITNLSDYYNSIEDSGTIFLNKNKNFKITINDLVDEPNKYVIFNKYNSIKIPDQSYVLEHFYDIHSYGKRGRRSSVRPWDKSLFHADVHNIYLLDKNELETRKQNAFLKKQFKHFNVVSRKKINIRFVKNLIFLMRKNENDMIFNEIREFIKDIRELAESKFKKYSSVVPPVVVRARRISYGSGVKIDRNTAIHIKYFYGRSYLKADNIKISVLEKSKQTIYYAHTEDEHKILQYHRYYHDLFNPDLDHTDMFSLCYDDLSTTPIRFILIAKTNLKFIKNLKNVKPYTEFLTILKRKKSNIFNIIEHKKFKDAYNNLDSTFLNKNLFKEIDLDYVDVINNLQKLRSKKVQNSDLYINDEILDIFNIDGNILFEDNSSYKWNDWINEVIDKTNKNKMFDFIKIDQSYDDKYDSELIKLLKLVYIK